MQLTVILLLVASSQAARLSTGSKRGNEETEKGKRESQRDSEIAKRTPLLPSVSPSASAGVEYATTKETHADQSPTQQVYASPGAQLSKISDVLAQGGAFQSAIASQLFSPISVYQPRLPTYEVSPPVPSQLAYAEHSVQPQSVQSIPKTNFGANYQLQLQQYEISSQLANYQRQIQYQQPSQYPQYNPEQLQYVQDSRSIHPQVAYRQELPINNYQSEQIGAGPVPVLQNIQQAYTPQPFQGAVSYASFALSQQEELAQNQQRSRYQPQPQQLVKYQLQHQPIQYQTQPQAQVQQQHYEKQQQAEQRNPSPQLVQAFQLSKAKYQPQIPALQTQPYQPQAVKATQSEKQLYFKQLQQPALIQQIQRQEQLQGEQKLGQYTQAPAQDLGYAVHAPPTFPPVQYFGKFAQSIIGQQ